MLIYSNNAHNNREYGIDISNTGEIEVSGNSLHDNFYAGAKMPSADEIFFYSNDINYNGKPNDILKAGLTYMGSNPDARIYIENNDLSNNGWVAFATYSADFSYLLLKDNIVDGSHDNNGYNVIAVNVDTVDVQGDHGKIWYGQ